MFSLSFLLKDSNKRHVWDSSILMRKATISAKFKIFTSSSGLTAMTATEQEDFTIEISDVKMSDNKSLGYISIVVEDITEYPIEEQKYNDSFKKQTIFEVENDFDKIPV